MGHWLTCRSVVRRLARGGRLREHTFRLRGFLVLLILWATVLVSIVEALSIVHLR